MDLQLGLRCEQIFEFKIRLIKFLNYVGILTGLGFSGLKLNSGHSSHRIKLPLPNLGCPD